MSWAGEYHGNNPEMSKLLHKAIRDKNNSAYVVYQHHLSNRPVNVNSYFLFEVAVFDSGSINFVDSIEVDHKL